MEKGREGRDSRADDFATGPPCPDPEILAAWLDQGLGVDERARVDAHLVGCDECRSLITHVLETQQALDVTAGERDAVEPVAELESASAAAAVAPQGRVVSRWGLAAFAVAAALVLAVLVGPLAGPWGSRRHADSRLADLAEAVGEGRTVEARLSSGFRYGPLRAPLRSGGSAAPMGNWTLYAAAGRIREDALHLPSAPNLHALGLAHLVLAELDEAVQAFEDAIAEDRTNAVYQSDLAAAYLARGKQADRADDFPRALAAAERASAIDSGLLEARFNRALALEELFLTDQARRAWEIYLSHDGPSPWGDDARRHLAALQDGDNSPVDSQRTDPPAVTNLTVDAGIEWILRRGLPAWAEAVTGGDSARAALAHSELQRHAAQLADVSGDGFAVALVNVPVGIDRSAVEFARSATAVGLGFARLAVDDIPGAEAAFQVGCPRTSGTLALLCEIELGAANARHGDDDGARRRVDVVLRTASSAYLRGYALRLQVYRLIYKGEPAASTKAATEAFDVFSRSKYLTQAGIMAAQLGDLYEGNGLLIEAWSWRRLALEAAAQTGSPSLGYSARMTAGWSLARSSNHEAARYFLFAADGDPRGGSRLQQVPALLSQARAALDAADGPSALTSLSAVGETLTASRDPRAVGMRSEVRALEGRLAWANGDFAAAEKALHDALEIMGPERRIHRAAALLERSRIRTAEGSNLDAAEQDLRLAVDLFGSNTSAPQQAFDGALAFSAAASLIPARPRLQNAQGLAITESIRRSTDGGSSARVVSAADLEELAGRLGPAETAVSYLFGARSLLVWVVSSSGIRYVELATSREEIGRLVAQLSVQLTRAPGQESAWRETLEQLHTLLVRDLPNARNAQRLIVVPDGPLSRVPFASLIDRQTGKFLFEQLDLRMAPNLSFAHDSNQPKAEAPRSVLAIGEPTLADLNPATFRRLPRARAEARTVASLYREATVLRGLEATKSAVLSSLPVADVVHFAGHAIPRRGATLPRLLLAGSVRDPATGLLPSDLRQRLAAPTVVLAACETAAAEHQDRATRVSELAESFLRSGAASVIATLWSVTDAASEEFFVNVHRELASGHPAAAAVTSARRACLANGPCRSDPGTWIGTTVFGHH